MTGRVALVIVSHSAEVARGTVDMVRQMVGHEVPIAHSGGNPAGGLGTDVASILAAIKTVWSPKGVAILVDLGGAGGRFEIDPADDALDEMGLRRDRQHVFRLGHRRRRLDQHGAADSPRRTKADRGETPEGQPN